MQAHYRYLVPAAIVGFALSSTIAGCTNVTGGKPAAEGSGASQGAKAGTRTPERGVDYDISRLSAIKNDFPPEQKVTVEPPARLGEDAAGFVTLAGDGAVVDPPGCITLAQPVRPGPDAQVAVVGGNGGGMVGVFAVKSPQPLPDNDTGVDCSRATITKDYAPDEAQTLTALTPPRIDGVRTSAARAEFPKSHTKSYVYSAFLSDTVAIAIWGMLSGNPREEAILADLLVKAVDAVRGQ